MMVRGCLEWQLGACFFSLLLGAACTPTAPSAAAQPGPAEPVVEADLAVLPNNVVIHSSRNKLIALRDGGEVAWELVLPNDDHTIAPVAVALNSIAYVRGAKFLHAASSDGKWLWSKPLEGEAFGKSRATNAPVGLSDSTVALMIGDDVVRFDLDGGVRFRMTLPEGHVSSRIAAAMDGSALIPTTAGIYAINPEGNVAWRRVLQH